MKTGSNALMLLVILAIGISFIAMYLSFCAITARYMRMTNNERDPQLRLKETARVFLSDDPSMKVGRQRR